MIPTTKNKIFNFNSNWNSKFLFAAYRSEKKQLKWILKHELYNVRWDDNLFEKRDGAIKEYFTPDYILLYDCRDYSKGCRLFKWDGNRTTATEEDMVKLGYPYPDGSYQLYGLDGFEVPGPGRCIEDNVKVVVYEKVEISDDIIHEGLAF